MPVAMAEQPADGYIRMNGTEVFRFATRIMVESTERLLAAAGLGIDDIDLVVAHQANSRILDHAAERLGVASRARSTATSSGTATRRRPRSRWPSPRRATRAACAPGDLLLLVGFGGGLTWGSTIVRYEPVSGEPA